MKLVASLVALLAAPPAGAVLFDFDDFDPSHPFGGSNYHCEPQCDAYESGLSYQSLTATHESLQLRITRNEGEWFSVWRLSRNETIIEVGDPAPFGLFELRFSQPLAKLTLDAEEPLSDFPVFFSNRGSSVDIDILTVAYVYNGEELLEALALSEPDPTEGPRIPLTFSHPEGFTHLLIGHVPETSPNCTFDCLGFTDSGGFSFDNVEATPVPEPSTVLLVAGGMLVLGIRRRIRDRH